MDRWMIEKGGIMKLDGWMDGRIGGQMDRLMEGWTDG